MARRETLITRYGELLDMILCLAIFEGRAEEKPRKRTYAIFDALELR